MTHIGFVFGVLSLASICSRLLTGRLAAWLGELFLLRLALALVAAAIGNALMLLGDSVAMGFFPRAVFGLGIGAASTLMIALASKIIPASRLGARGRAGWPWAVPRPRPSRRSSA